ncbi:MAG: helix-turn-helix transcriptional regulator [Lachnospiraceae bacterium]|nr:helix-turn-helix transcriptional regulator [Lachnospiraceae bacterium]
MNKQDESDLIVSDKPQKAEQLARLRSYADLTQKMLAEKSGVSVRMIEHYEQGKKDINHASAETIFRLSKALGCKMEDLINTDFKE